MLRPEEDIMSMQFADHNQLYSWFPTVHQMTRNQFRLYIFDQTAHTGPVQVVLAHLMVMSSQDALFSISVAEHLLLVGAVHLCPTQSHATSTGTL